MKILRLPGALLGAALVLFLAGVSQPGHSGQEAEGKILLVVGSDGVAVVDPWRRTLLRQLHREVRNNPAFSPDARWMAETDVDGASLRIVDLEGREGDKEVLSGSEMSPLGALFGEDASKLWVLSGATRSLFQVIAPQWKMGKNLPLQGPAPKRAWRAQSHGFVWQPPAVLSEVDVRDGKLLGSIAISGASEFVTDPQGDFVLAFGPREWTLFAFGHREAEWRSQSKGEASHVCLGPPALAAGGGPEIIMLSPDGRELLGQQVTISEAATTPSPTPAGQEPTLDAYLPPTVEKVTPTPAPAVPKAAPVAQVMTQWRTPLPGKYSCILASPDGATLYLGQTSPPELLVVNARTHQAIARLPLPYSPQQLVWP